MHVTAEVTKRNTILLGTVKAPSAFREAKLPPVQSPFARVPAQNFNCGVKAWISISIDQAGILDEIFNVDVQGPKSPMCGRQPRAFGFDEPK
jgi:hypothetical protein